MAQDCPSLQTEAVKRGLVLSSLETTNGSVVRVTCAYEDQQLVGNSELQCLGGSWSTELPKCSGDDDLSDREILIIAVAAAVVGVLIVMLLVVIVCVYCAKERRKMKLSRSLQSRLDSLSLRDPLDELVRRESQRTTPNPSFHNPMAWTQEGDGQSSNKRFYKVWNHLRTNKQIVFAETLSELCQKAAQRLTLQGPLRVVLEEDGSEVISEEVLALYNGTVLLVLEPGEVWTPPDPRDAGRYSGGDGGAMVTNGDVGKERFEENWDEEKL